MTWTEYHDLLDIELYSAYLADFYDFVSLKTIGKSYEGRSMKVVQVGFLQYIGILISNIGPNRLLDLHQDINRGFVFSRYLNGTTFP